MKVGVNTVRTQVIGVERAQSVISDATAVIRRTTELRERHNGVTCRATPRLPRMLTLELRKQMRTGRRIDQRHVSLRHTHGLQFCVGHLVFGIDEGVAYGVKGVVFHGVW